MSPARMGGLAYWASGGSVAGRRGPVTLSRAVELLGFFNDEAEALLGAGDAAAARCCADLALELGCAVAKAASWRRCAGDLGRPATSRGR
jgi:hypothetical protein